jgi:hypothetical protein
MANRRQLFSPLLPRSPAPLLPYSPTPLLPYSGLRTQDSGIYESQQVRR